MGKHVANTFCNLCTFVFLLYFAKVLSASTQQTIADVMKSDKLCSVPAFLFESNITKNCSDLKYPVTIELDYKYVDTFLCLAFYDTWYKTCKSDQLLKPFNDTTTFYSYMQKFFPKDNEQAEQVFCKNVAGITFSHPKLKPLLSHMNLNKSRTCYDICFGMNDKFKQLCAILAWSISIDRNGRKDTSEGKVSATDKTKVAKGAGAGESQIEKEEALEKASSNIKENKEGSVNAAQKSSAVPDTANNPASAADNPAKIQKSMDDNYTPVVNQQEGLLPDVGAVEESVPKPSRTENFNENAGREAASDVKDEPKVSANNEKRPEVRDEEVEVEDNNGAKDTIQNGNSGAREIFKNENNDMKTSTISEGTQDYDIANQRDKNDPEHNLHESISLADNENQVMPKPSEQRDFITHYSNIRSDEESHFFTYFTVVSLICIAAYIGYHNKQKILAIVLEGRRSRSNRGRRRPSTASYRKLDCTLEEAVTSQCNANVTHVIY